MVSERNKRKLSAILCADVKDYSRHMNRDEAGTIKTLKVYRTLLAEYIVRYGGRVVDSPGDNLLAEFNSAVHAVECAVKIQNELKIQNQKLPQSLRMELRIGINLGDVIEDGDHIYGDGVNITARIQSLAEAGGICISGTTFDQIENKLPFQFQFRGEQRVKNIKNPVRIYALRGAESHSDSGEKFSLRKTRGMVIVAVIMILSLMASILWYRGKREESNVSTIQPSIAVLPFVDMSREKNQEYFADGLAEELIHDLSKIPELRVVGRTSSFQFKEKSEDLRVIGEKLKVATILEGSVRNEERRLRITAQLINAADGYHLWSAVYERELTDIFEVQGEIARSVARELKVKLLDQQQPSSHTSNTEAYNFYLLGQYFYGRQTQESLEEAVGYYQQAIKLDSGYAPAWTGLAASRALQAAIGYIPTNEGFRVAKEAIDKALEQDPNLARAHAVKGWIQMSYDWDWSGAYDSYQQALSLDPGRGALEAAQLYAALGRFQQSVRLAKESVEKDPLSAQANFTLAFVNFYAGHLEDAVGGFNKLLKLNPEFPNVHTLLGQIFLLNSQPEQALAEIRQEAKPFRRLPGLAMAYHALGKKQESEKELIVYIDSYQEVAAYQIAQVYAFRGDIEQAFQWLDRAYEQRDTGLFLMKYDPMFKSLRGDPRYPAFLKKMKL
ncbi:MAG: tetratricopeptide repeat protein [bacterium]|nr:MAG: tetratricopeptide repeat protein [bacterium]